MVDGSKRNVAVLVALYVQDEQATGLITFTMKSEGFGWGGLGNEVRNSFTSRKLYLIGDFFFLGGGGSVEGVNRVVGSIPFLILGSWREYPSLVRHCPLYVWRAWGWVDDWPLCMYDRGAGA